MQKRKPKNLSSVLLLITLLTPTIVFAGDDAVTTVLNNLYDFIKKIAIPGLAIGVVGFGGLLMAKGMIALTRFIWFIVGGALIGGAPAIVRILFTMF